MTKKKDPQKESNENYWKAQRGDQVKSEFNQFLKDKGLEKTQESIERFTIPITRNGEIKYNGFTEKELIILLGGKIPDWY